MVGLRSDLPDGNDTIAHRMCRPRLEQDQSGAAQRGVRTVGLRTRTLRRMLGGGAPPRSRMTDMQDNKPPVWSSRKSILVAVIVALAVLFGGYQVGKDMALRDNARQAAGR
ncbi:hypothetical protein [Stenotrophomonas maltophilia]